MSKAISHDTLAAEFEHKLMQIDSLTDGIASLLGDGPGEQIGSAHYLLFSIQDLVRDLQARVNALPAAGGEPADHAEVEERVHV